MKDTAHVDEQAYLFAKGYLPNLNIDGVTSVLIEKYLNPCTLDLRPTTKRGIYRRVLESAQNANMKAGVIGRAISGVDKLSPVLMEFDPKAVLDKYEDDWKAILEDIVEQLQPRGEIRRTPRSIWPLYCQTIVSAAHFVEQFESPDNFFSWINFFDCDARARASLPMLLSHEIKGFGFALSCDFLKGMGYINFPKPDVHLRDIFSALSLCPAKPDDYSLFKSIIRVAAHANVSPYNVDKAFWLIGSGYFHNDPQIGSRGRIGSQKREFVKYVQERLYETQ